MERKGGGESGYLETKKVDLILKVGPVQFSRFAKVCAYSSVADWVWKVGSIVGRRTELTRHPSLVMAQDTGLAVAARHLYARHSPLPPSMGRSTSRRPSVVLSSGTRFPNKNDDLACVISAVVRVVRWQVRPLSTQWLPSGGQDPPNEWMNEKKANLGDEDVDWCWGNRQTFIIFSGAT